ncbi:MAG TPA: IS110 family transposase [Candidatus Angelobacter sp.]|nr:IS110 family transposase [Candidatus Angelobacter sp.]
MMAEKEDVEKQESSRRQIQGLPVVRGNVAGIDLGSKEHWICAPTVDGSGREVASFGATTPELIRMAEWLKARQVESVAMESTGVYWIAPHEVLEAQGLQVLLVDTRQLARVPGRDKKTDPTDCEWIQRLHSCGLLRGSFRPEEAICMLRTLVRDKGNLVAERGDWVRRMQKSLDQMNVRVHRAVSDIDGVTGMAILRAIAGGERDAQKLAQLRDRRCNKTEEEIAEQLSGHWREDHLFSLQQALKMYDAVQERIAAYEKEILRKLRDMEREDQRGQTPPPAQNPSKAKTIRQRGLEPKREALYRVSGVDITQIDAIGVETVEVVLSEYGPDLSCFPTEKQFVSHITLAPHVAKSGGKPIKKKKRNSASTRVAAALRMAALSLRHSQTALGAYYRKIARRIGGDVAVFATARKLAILIYRLLRWGQPYVDEGAATYENRYREERIRSLMAKAKELGYQVAPLTS